MNAKEAIERINRVGNHQPILASGERYYIYQYDSKPFAPLIDQISSMFPSIYIINYNTNYLKDSPSHLVSETVFTNVWISAADSLTPAHYDKADNLLLQVRGKLNTMRDANKARPNDDRIEVILNMGSRTAALFVTSTRNSRSRSSNDYQHARSTLRRVVC